MRPFFVLIIRSMNKDFEKLFFYLEPPEPPQGLLNKILKRIKREKQLAGIKRRIAIFSFGVLGSAIAFVPVFAAVQAGMAHSGFVDFSSLIFSDFSTVIKLWNQFALSLLESLPVMSMAILLAVIFIFLASLKYLVKNITTFFSSSQLINNS